MPTLQGRGPFSYESLAFNSGNTYALNAGSATAPKTQFDSTNGETLEVFANAVLLEGDGSVANAVDAAAESPAHGFYVNSLTTPTTITLVSNISTGQVVLIRRISNRATPEVDFAPGSVIREQDLDDSTNQTLHVAQEAIDIALQGIVLDVDDKWDAQTASTDRKIKGVLAGVADTDAVNKAQLTATELTTLGYRDEAEADRVSTAADVVLTHADVVLTHADVVLTNADVVSAEADRVSVAADLVATNQDTIDTAADLVATNQDTIDTAADVVLAEADKVQTGLDRVATAADVVLTNADVVLTHADELLTRADTVLTAADVVTTTASELAARNSAAAVSQTYDNFSDVYLGSMADGATATSGTATGAWSKDSSTVTVTSVSGTIEAGQVVTGTGIPTSPKPNILSTTGVGPVTSFVLSDTMVAVGSGVSLTFTGYGIYGAFNVSKDGPALDNDGDALATGALYFNTSDNTMKIYDGGNWIAATSAGTASLLEYKFVTTSAQVSSRTYTGTADIGGSMSYTASNTLVFLNGVLLKETVPSGATHDYVGQNGTSIVLTAAAVLNDEITVVAYKSFTVSDTVSSSSGGTFSGAVVAGAGLTGTTITTSGLITANGGIETDTNSKIKQKGAFMQSSTHQALTLGA